LAQNNNVNAQQVADQLNALYHRTSPCENNQPAYYCSGVIVHGQLVPVKDEDDKPLPSWYLPSYRKIGSFSYLRADITPQKGEPIWINTGYILTPAEELEAKKQYPYQVYCAFAGDGGTFGEVDTSCFFKFSIDPNIEIDTNDLHSINDYVTKILEDPYSTEWRNVMIPAFRADRRNFDLAMQIYGYVFKDNLNKVNHSACISKTRCRVHNELIISAWEAEKVDAAQVPIMAFFAIINDDQNPMFENTGRTSTSDEEMNQLFRDAEDYSKAAHYARSIPVITIDMAKLRSGASDVFAPAVKPDTKRYN
jgi:hypothetical protein